MKIKSIGYGRTISDGNYNNEKYYIEAELEDWEDASASLQVLRKWVNREYGLKEEMEDLREKRNQLKDEIVTLKLKAEQVKDTWKVVEMRWKEAILFLKNHGLEIQEKLPKRPSFEILEEEEETIYPTPVRVEEVSATTDVSPF